MNLCVDIGNTRAKLALFTGGKLSRLMTVRKISLPVIYGFVKSRHLIRDAVLSSVVQYPDKINRYLSKNFRFTRLTSKTPLPFKINYKTTRTLGSDRIALAAGAFALFPAKDFLVVSSGTCITYDFINGKKIYAGGGISPGISMRLAALHHYTGKLPLVPFTGKKPPVTGNSTRLSMLSGVINGTLSEITGIIVTYKKRFPRLKVIITGGDGKFIFKSLKNNNSIKNYIFAKPNLVLEGLNYILEYNSGL